MTQKSLADFFTQTPNSQQYLSVTTNELLSSSSDESEDDDNRKPAARERTADDAVMLDAENEPVSTVATAVVDNTPPETLAAMKQTIVAVFILPMKEFHAQLQRTEISLNLKKLSVTEIVEKSTAEAAALVEEEAPASRLILGELIAKKTAEHTKGLTKEIQRLQNKVKSLESSKKPTRGQGAPTTKKKPNRRETRRKMQRQRHQAIRKPREH